MCCRYYRYLEHIRPMSRSMLIKITLFKIQILIKQSHPFNSYLSWP